MCRLICVCVIRTKQRLGFSRQGSYHFIGKAYYINITFPDWVIVENIIPRNVIINRGAAEVDNHVSRDDIFDFHPFDFHPFREWYIYFIIPNIRSFIFYRLRPTMVRGVPKEKQFTASYGYACLWMKIHLSQKCFFWTVWMLELIMTSG